MSIFAGSTFACKSRKVPDRGWRVCRTLRSFRSRASCRSGAQGRGETWRVDRPQADGENYERKIAGSR